MGNVNTNIPKGLMGLMIENDYAFKGVYLVSTDDQSKTEGCTSTIISGKHFGVFGIIEQTSEDFIIGKVKDENGDGSFERDLFRFNHGSLGFP